MGKTKVLVVDDEKDIVKLLRFTLEREGYQVVTAADGDEAVKTFQKEKPDFVILDLMLPKLNGLQVCAAIRQESNVPLLMLTARRGEMDRVEGLETGADDYLTKPFSVRELIARMRAILRRGEQAEQSQSVLRFGELNVDLARYVVSVKGKPLSLTTKELEILKALIHAKGQALARERLLEQVWGYDRSFDIDTRTVDQHVARLRNKLGPEAKRIITVKKMGYRFHTES